MSNRWKKNIITENSNTCSDDQQFKDQPNFKKEVKADILEAIEKENVFRREELIEFVDSGSPALVKRCLQELKEENVLEVKNR